MGVIPLTQLHFCFVLGLVASWHSNLGLLHFIDVFYFQVTYRLFEGP